MLSQDHKPTREDESKRIRDAGGFVINSRVMGELAVSRAFGDVDFKKGIQSIIEQEGGTIPGADGSTEGAPDGSNWDQPLIIAEPEIQVFLFLICSSFLLMQTPLTVGCINTRL